MIAKRLHNGVTIVTAEATEPIDSPQDWEHYGFSHIRKPLNTIEQRSGRQFDVSLSAGSLVFVRPGEIECVDICRSGNSVVSLSAVLIKPELAAELLGDMHLDGHRGTFDPITAGLLETAAKLDDTSDPLLVDHITLAILHRIRGLRPDKPTRCKGRIERVLAYIDERIDSHLTLTELSGIAAMSAFHFVRTFRESTGATPLAYVTQKRIEIAKQRLLRSELPLATIAELCGFSSQSAFSSVFRRSVGVTPTEYRKSMLV